MTPRKAKTTDQIVKQNRDNVEHGDYAILIDENNIYLNKQKMGEPASEKICIPRAVFDSFVDWYERGIVPAEDTRTTDARIL